MRPRRSIARGLAAASLLAGGTLMAAYGVLAMRYRHHDRGDTYVLLVGHKFDADLVGGCAILVGAVAIVAGAVLLRRSRFSADS